MTRTGLQSCPPEICSHICQDPILERLDLNSICFVSHAFRNEAQRELSYRFPCLRGGSEVKAWCSALKSKPNRATNVMGLVLVFPAYCWFSDFNEEDIKHLTRTVSMCVNMKELAAIVGKFAETQEPEDLTLVKLPTHMLSSFYGLKLTKFVNGYFSQGDAEFIAFLRVIGSQPCFESLQLHSGKMGILKSQLPLHFLKALGCAPQFLDKSYSMTRLRLDLVKSLDSEYLFYKPRYSELDVLGRVLEKNLTRNMKSLALHLKQKDSHFPEIIRVIAGSHLHIQHLEIHQFIPTKVEKDLPLPLYSYGRNIKTLVFRPPRGLPKNAGDNPNLCAYIELRTPSGRRKAAEKLIMRTLPTLTRLVLIVHGNDYEFRRNLFTGVITGEKKLLARDKHEWASVK